VHLVKASDWDVSLADFTIYCDACPGGLGFWYPDLDDGFFSDISTDAKLEIIYFYEALCVFCAIRNVSSLAHRGARVVIYTDNFNTVHLFNSLNAQMRSLTRSSNPPSTLLSKQKLTYVSYMFLERKMWSQMPYPGKISMSPLMSVPTLHAPLFNPHSGRWGH
jgi:hypothetical protein